MLSKNKDYYIVRDLIRQMIRSSTSIGANLAEADVAITKKEFNKILYISLKEAKEIQYRYGIFEKSLKYTFKTNKEKLDEIVRILYSITNKIRKQ